MVKEVCPICESKGDTEPKDIESVEIIEGKRVKKYSCGHTWVELSPEERKVIEDLAQVQVHMSAQKISQYREEIEKVLREEE